MATVTSITSGYEITVQEGFADSLNGAVSSGATTVTLNTTSGYTDGDKVVLTVDRVDSSGTLTPSKEQTFYGEISGNSIINVVWTEGSNQSHSDGAVVEDLVTATHHLVNNKWVKVDHDENGQHKTLTDANGNEWIKQTATASAVNELTVANAATGEAVTLSATGDDTNIDLSVKAKGSGHTTLHSPVALVRIGMPHKQCRTSRPRL